jgi:hypothetical protein
MNQFDSFSYWENRPHLVEEIPLPLDKAILWISSPAEFSAVQEIESSIIGRTNDLVTRTHTHTHTQEKKKQSTKTALQSGLVPSHLPGVSP